MRQFLRNAPSALTRAVFGALGAAPLLAMPQSGGLVFPAELKTYGDALLGWKPMLSSDVFRMSFSFSAGYNVVSTIRNERVDNQATWQSVEATTSTSFQITDASSRPGTTELFVAGVTAPAEGGNAILEKWVFPVPRGGHSMAWTGTPQPRGTALSTSYAPGLLVSTSGTFVPIAQRTAAPPAPVRTVLWTGLSLGVIKQVAVDPEGRFLFFQVHPAGDLYVLDLLTPNATPALELAASVAPHLAASRSFEIRHHATYGRLCVLTEATGCVIPQSGQTTYLLDAQNDGVFESHVTAPNNQLATLPFANSSNWTTLYVKP